ncbi:MAG: hypothetical protein F6K48_17035 [Okeania sp. SIO3H1]|nr:hypothetical protein [Okeania sp. SIO3H1]
MFREKLKQWSQKILVGLIVAFLLSMTFPSQVFAATVLQKPIIELTNAEFSRPSQANSYYPANVPPTHIHLGVPTQYQGQVARPGNVFVTFISIKVNDIPQGNLTRCSSGYYDSNTFPNTTPQEFKNVLDSLDLLVSGCR